MPEPDDRGVRCALPAAKLLVAARRTGVVLACLGAVSAAAGAAAPAAAAPALGFCAGVGRGASAAIAGGAGTSLWKSVSSSV
mmetsp:Transcript_22684/g.85958  ORF Transcript_22684/g.85958 Transcript_22684/m.85958 type:complete len:82 (+) Transcript_22684:309-554(+)